MKAKLIRKIPKEEQVRSWERYEFECIRCGKHYTRKRIDPRTVPYCGYCEKQVNREKIIERQEKKERDLVNGVLEKVKAGIEEMELRYDLSPAANDMRTEEEKRQDLLRMYKCLVMGVIEGYIIR